MTIPTITALPEIPAYSDANFETKAPAVLSALRNTFIAEMNAAIAAINNYDYGAAVNISKVVGLTAGYVPYGAGTSALASNANLNYDAANSRLNTPVLRASTGVLFGTDTAAANTLDDYEEATWTPTVTPQTSGTITLNTSLDLLSYTKIGDTVMCRGMVEVASVSSPVGTYITVSLPAGLTPAVTPELSGRFITTVYKGASDQLPGGIYFSPVDGIRVVIDASTIISGNQFYFNFQYKV